MFLAPRLAPGEKPRSRLVRGLTGFGWVSTAAVLIVVNLVLVFLHYFIVVPAVTPVELYHRAWQMARDNIYDQSLLHDWDKWEHKYDAQIKTEEDAIKYINEMIASLHEPVTGFLDARTVAEAVVHADDHLEGVGIEFALDVGGDGNPRMNPHGKALPAFSADGYPVIKQSLRGSPAYKAGIKSGDLVTSVDGKSTAGWTVEQLVAALQGKIGTPVTIEVRRNGSTQPMQLSRDIVRIPIVTTKHLPNKIGYLRLETFDRWDTDQQMKEGLEDLADCDGLIIDLRGNGGGFIHSAVKAASYFLDSGTITTIDMRVPEHGYLKYSIGVDNGRFVANLADGPLSSIKVKLPGASTGNMTGKKPVIILVDDWTASASELFTGALKDNGRVIVIGVKTYGKGIGQTFVPVGNGSRLRITNQKLWSPNGDFRGDCGVTVSNGVVPDIIVPPARGLIFGDDDNDNQLKVAVEEMLKQLRAKP